MDNDTTTRFLAMTGDKIRTARQDIDRQEKAAIELALGLTEETCVHAVVGGRGPTRSYTGKVEGLEIHRDGAVWGHICIEPRSKPIFRRSGRRRIAVEFTSPDTRFQILEDAKESN